MRPPQFLLFCSVWDAPAEDRARRLIPPFLCRIGILVLQAVAIIELARRGWVESVPVQNRTWTVLVHQLLALTLQFTAISNLIAVGELLSVVPDFAGLIDRNLIN